ncbi:MAG TPA: poly(R)-hydroxyalkanoic acid synthase subunit PhaE, partial [Saprospiraceae bacterium]|nr:poly(R)-hydroxyalkanoic acid synthase subunit PhaE [Saprospiraceae bacterium]
MSDSTDSEIPSNHLINAWMKITTDFYGAMGKMWMDAFATQQSPPAGRFQDYYESSKKAWDVIANIVREPSFMATLQKGLQSTPEITTRLLQTGINGFLELQKRWGDRIQKLGSADAYSFSDLDKEFLNRWTDIYKNEFRQFLNVPQLGVAKFYQERINQTLDRYNLFQTAMTEFLHLLSVPLEKSFSVMQEKLSEMTKGGKLPEDFKPYYTLWIKVLEGHYMTLFQSSQYTEALAKTLDALNRFVSARNEVLEDMLKSLPVS